MSLFLKIIQILLVPLHRIFFRVFFKINLIGKENLFKIYKNPVIFASNHKSFIDPLFANILPIKFAPIKFLAAKEYFNFLSKNVIFPLSIFVALYVRLNWSIPIDRENKNINLEEKLKKAVSAINNGYNIWIFPEGKVNKSNQLGTFKRGVGYLHKVTKAPIIPVAIIYY